MAFVSADDIRAYLGKSDEDDLDLSTLNAHIMVSTAMVRAYVRDRGFDPDTKEPAEDLAAVIVSCTARQVANPTHDTATSTSIDDASFQKSPGVFRGWTLPELAVLHRYRTRAK